ncbi:MAG: hypothetical protein HY296_05940 [Thaumarchaeota archaeon]|nr:hypothetical protein [Nitrososphaerota archaeon]
MIATNRPLVALSIFLIISGALFGGYAVSAIGLILFMVAVASGSRIPRTTVPSGSTTLPPGRVAPPQRIIPKVETSFLAPPPASSPSAPSPAPFQKEDTYTGALFPTSIFPALSPMQSPSTRLPPERPGQAGERDQLLEFGAIIAFLKLAFG